MQHGEALSADVDADRPLAEVGRRNVLLVAAHAAARGVRVERIVHSGKLRAEQTAEILADELGCRVVEQVAGLKPSDAVEAVAAAMLDPGRPGSLALVGHLPFLERLASLLVAGDSTAHVVAFRNAGLVKLAASGSDISDAPGFSVSWILTPELVLG